MSGWSFLVRPKAVSTVEERFYLRFIEDMWNIPGAFAGHGYGNHICFCSNRGPRPHDMRHTFAVHCLNSWVLAGEDLTAGLPVLSTYLGHNDLSGTQRYLQLTAQMYPDITQKLEKQFGELIPTMEVPR